MNKILATVAFMAAVGVGAINAQDVVELCQGIVETNDLQIPEFDENGNKVQTGLTEQQFNHNISQVLEVYGPIVSSMGGRLSMNRLWSDNTVNASANRSGRTWKVNMYGGLARHPSITPDGFTMVICHEVGHHLGGAPKYKRWFFNTWASNEGQSDYFASLKCLRKVWSEDENIAWAKDNDVDSTAKAACDQVYSTDTERARCYRTSMAGLSLASVFQSLRNQRIGPRFDTPDRAVTRRTSHGHPASQCRLDTYFQGALCDVEHTVDVHQRDETVGTCNRADNYRQGVRPTCWFKPDTRTGFGRRRLAERTIEADETVYH